MKSRAGEIGRLGEDYAAKYLRKKRYKILERNYRTKLGEIDIIAQDGSYTVFVEVKTRHTNPMTQPFEAVDFRKQRKLVRTAVIYSEEKRLYNHYFRFDVVEVFVDAESKKCAGINHIEGAFEPENGLTFF